MPLSVKEKSFSENILINTNYILPNLYMLYWGDSWRTNLAKQTRTTATYSGKN